MSFLWIGGLLSAFSHEQSAQSGPKEPANRVARGIGPVILMLVIGSILTFLRDYCDMYTASRIAALLHFVGVVTKWKKWPWNPFLILAFALYSIVLTYWFERNPILQVLLLGGLFHSLRKLLLDCHYRWQRRVLPGVPILILILSFCITHVPNVVLCPTDSASIRAEYAYFHFRSPDLRHTGPQDDVVIWQQPPPAAFPFNIRLSFCGPQSIFSPLRLQVWPTLKYKLGPLPEVTITALRAGHGVNDYPIVPVDKRQDNIVTQFHRIYGTFRHLPKDNNQLHLRVLVMPKKSVMKLYDKIAHRWFVQPHSVLDSDAQLKLEYHNEEDGIWHVDAFFGAPQDQGDLFEIMALVTTRNLERGQILGPEEEVVAQARVYDNLAVHRDR